MRLVPQAPTPRPYQRNASRDVRNAWASGAIDVGLNMPTGAGKTVTFSYEMLENNGGSVAVAHRQELVAQISIALARNGVRHRLVAADKTVRNINALHMAELGYSYYDANSRHAAAGIDTLIRLKPNERAWTGGVSLYVQDEAHHCLKGNKWGRGREMFPTARGLHVSATWIRADGKGHGRHADGYVDTLVNAPTMRDLINMGYLTDYRILSVKPQDLNLDGVELGSDGDFNQHQLREATKKSNRIVGDVVRHYLEWAPGKLGVTFAVDIEAATAIVVAFRAAGVPAEIITGETPDGLRLEILRKFKRREILQLVNVDLFGEGFDLPAIEVVSFARATQSWALYCQQFGRVLRLLLPEHLRGMWDQFTDAQRLAYIAMSEKPFGMIIDHVGNVLRHMGPPDKRIEFSLDRRERRSSGVSDAIPMRDCLNPRCAWPYERVHKCCPKCGHYPEPVARTGPEFVDGDLIELTPEVLAQMRGEIAKVDGAVQTWPGMSQVVRFSLNKNHEARREAQAALRHAMSWWCGLEDARGRPNIEEQYRRFYLQFGIDTASAQALGAPEAEKLRNKICEYLLRFGIDGTVNPALS